MQRMPNIALTEEEYKRIVTYCQLYSGSEGIICQYERKDTVYKIFKDEISDELHGLSDNKFKKILELYKRKLANFVQPVSTISLNGQLIGYEITYDRADIRLEDKWLRRPQLIQILNQTSEILHSLAEQDITYADVKRNNILINAVTGQPKFCDIDNMRIGQYPVDLLNYHARAIVDSRFCVDETVDQYLHNLMTIQMLQVPGCTYDDILDLVDSYFREDYADGAQEILATMSSPKSFKGGYIAPYIKK